MILLDSEVMQRYGLLRELTVNIREAKKEQRKLIKLLRKSGLSARCLGRVSDMSPQTILNIAKADR